MPMAWSARSALHMATMVPHTRLRPPMSLASRRAAPPAPAPAESSALRRWAHPALFTGGSWCTALTWPPKPSRPIEAFDFPAERALPGVRCRRSRAARRHHLHPGAGHHAGGLTGRRHGHAGLATWAGWCGVVPSAQATWLGCRWNRGEALWKGTSQFPARAHCRAGVTVSGGQSAASHGALPDGVRLLRLAGVRCCAGVAALVLGIGWAVRADAGRSVPAWGFTGGHCAALGARTAPA